MYQEDHQAEYQGNCEVKINFDMIPRVITKMGLDPYELSLYIHLKATAGDRGSCFKSNKTLAEEMVCSPRKLIEIKKQLEDRGLIIVKKRINENGSPLPDLITIVDVYEFKLRPQFNKMGGHAPHAPPPMHHMHDPHAPGAHKQDLSYPDLKQQQEAPKNLAAVSLKKKKTRAWKNL